MFLGCKTQSCQRWSLGGALQKSALGISKNSQTKPVLESLSNNIATLLKRDSGAGCFRTSYWQMLYKIDILKNSQNSQESTCVRVSFLIKCHVSNLQFFGKRDSSVNFAKFLTKLYWWNTFHYNKTDEWYIQWQRAKTSDHNGKKSNNDWQRVTTGDNHWQRVTISAITTENEWQWTTNEWHRMMRSDYFD